MGLEVEDLAALEAACTDCGACPAYHKNLAFSSAEDLCEFRSALLSWFDSNRRKLPWRGDPPPFTSWATTRAASGCATGLKKNAESGKSTSSILSFFAKKEKPDAKTLQGSPPPATTDASGPASDSARGSAGTRQPKRQNEEDANGGKGKESSPAQAQTETDRERVSPYGVWVSEVMLQQTQVCTVIDYWQRWVARWPTVASLAEASEEEVSQMWSGLGYYRRARQLLEGARTVVRDFAGELPSHTDSLRSIPGIGPYTAGAISAIAFGNRAAAVDGNVIRVFSRLFALAAPADSRALAALCNRLMPPLLAPDRAGASTEALIELGATICSPRTPSCRACPVRKFCLANKEAKEDVVLCKSRQNVHASACKLCIPFADAQAAVRERQQAAYPAAKAVKTRREETYVALCVVRRCARETPAEATANASPARRAPPQTDAQRVLKAGSGAGQTSEPDEALAAWELLLRRRPSSGLLASQLEVPSYLLSYTGGAGDGGAARGKEGTCKRRRKCTPESGTWQESQAPDDAAAAASPAEEEVDLTRDETDDEAASPHSEKETRATDAENPNEAAYRSDMALRRGRGTPAERPGDPGGSHHTAGSASPDAPSRGGARGLRCSSTDPTQRALRELMSQLRPYAVITDAPIAVGQVAHAFSHVEHVLNIFFVESDVGERSNLFEARGALVSSANPSQPAASGNDDRETRQDEATGTERLQWAPVADASVSVTSTEKEPLSRLRTLAK
ncbi:helix-hairpin-helix motif domain-containing protein [Besnoitia besnoiti]|uniref:Adenine DNA glycosylase n=1 Tax=Besnoitia besnoiti TaxID=94643 RepID=A0A2A9MAR2_BESBE|nr:helix-hairpin-helix motif domain-containing protein [Besnoitia besnoiti]PFH34294.1 helix-hairpin-helix motif domain-containing protein [Besnoitia besnoiti]